MTFTEAVKTVTLQYRMRRPWKNGDHKHMWIKDGILVFSHQHPLDTNYVELEFIPFVQDILADDWEILNCGF